MVVPALMTSFTSSSLKRYLPVSRSSGGSSEAATLAGPVSRYVSSRSAAWTSQSPSVVASVAAGWSKPTSQIQNWSCLAASRTYRYASARFHQSLGCERQCRLSEQSSVLV